jgi:hypothetical protein
MLLEKSGGLTSQELAGVICIVALQDKRLDLIALELLDLSAPVDAALE